MVEKLDALHEHTIKTVAMLGIAMNDSSLPTPIRTACLTAQVGYGPLVLQLLDFYQKQQVPQEPLT